MPGVRHKNGRLPYTISKPEGRRGVGRPKLRWFDDVEADIKTLGTKSWRLKDKDRKEWMVILKEATAELKGA
jgi:hypothetical protein